MDGSEPSSKFEPMPQGSRNGRPAEDLKELLDRVRMLCRQPGESFSDSLARISELQQRLAEERFHFAVLGQFKRGKSTLINAILGEALLPTGVVPLTSIPTFLSAGKTRTVRVVFRGNREAVFPGLTLDEAKDVLARHVTEKENPGNRIGVECVEVEHPASILEAGVVLIDTPGIGSTLRHNTEATLAFLPQCDAALFIVSADPPLTEVEKDFLQAVRDKVAKICFVMNKVDYLGATELHDALLFFEKILKELGLAEAGAVFKVSAKNGIEARIKNDSILWRASGLEDLQNYLLEFLSREKAQTLRLALAKKALGVVADLSVSVGIRQRALELSREELDKRIETFDAKVKEIAQEQVKAGDLLAGDRKRMVQFLEERAEQLRGESRQYLEEIIRGVFKGTEATAAAERQARAALAEQIPPFFQEHLVSFSEQVEQTLRHALLTHQQRLDELVRAVRSAAAELFDIPYRAVADDARLERAHKPYWVTQKWNTTVSPVPEGFFDRFLPAAAKKRRMQRRLLQELHMLVVHNVENIRWSTLRNLDGAFRNFSATLDERIRKTAEATREAMQVTNLRRKQVENMTRPEVERLKQSAAEIAELESALSRYSES